MSLELSQLQIRYKGQHQAALEQVSFTLDAGQIGVLIGPSGCGKSTLLRAVAGLEDVEQGRILLEGREVSSTTKREAPEHRRVGMVFQDYALFPHLTVEKNIAFGLYRWPDTERRERVQEMLHWVGLLDAQSKYPHEISGGQQQRVALARALAPKPDILLLDEPFSNLDVDLRERLAHEMRDLLKKSHTTTLFVTHDQGEAFAMGDHVGVLQQGRLHQWDTPYRLYHAPASRFVATFIGDGVFLAGQRIAGPGLNIQTELGVLHSLADTDLTMSHAHADVPLNGDCDVLVRSDDVLIHDDNDSHRAILEHKAFRGSHYLYVLRLPSGQTLTATVPSHQQHPIGATLGFSLQMDHLIVFPKAKKTSE